MGLSVIRAGCASLPLLVSLVALGCDGPFSASRVSANDSPPVPTGDASIDRQPTEEPTDASTDGGGGCTPSAGVACQDATTLVRCREDGTATETVACARGCNESPTPHCAMVVPTGIAPASDFSTPDLAELVLDVGNVVHSDTGEIEGLRPPNPNPRAFFVHEGIGFHVVTADDHSVGVFVVDRLTVKGTMNGPRATPVRVVGTHSVVFLAKGDVEIGVLNVAADCTTNTPGPGGFAGGTPTALGGGGPGGGAGGSMTTVSGGGGAVITLFSGAGGGGHGGRGGAGAISNAGGASGGVGGAGDTDTALVKLIGGSGGGATPGAGSHGGAGGGAVQIVSQTSILVQHGIAAGGCGGRSTGNGAGGGGAGGAILLEAPTVTVAEGGFLLAGGGGGAGGSVDGKGNDAASDHEVALVGRGGLCGSKRCGGDGAHLASTAGGNGTVDGQQVGAGGGGVGRIRINTLTGSANLSTEGTLYVPSISSSEVFSQGLVAIE
mgnify:FL=1